MTTVSPPAPAADLTARALVWTVWAAMTAFLALYFAADRTNVPLAEDWLMVPAFTGHEPDPGGWLWSQNNEHRVPLPRLIYLGVLELTGGKFVAVGWLSLALQAAAAAGLIVLARRLRGRTDVADAFFPLQLLHWGHSVQFLFPFLISLVVPTVATLGLGALLAASPGAPRLAAWAAGGLALLSLPLCGLTGLLYVPGAALALGLAAASFRQQHRAGSGGMAAALVLAGAITLTLVVSGLYFVGYETPWWNPPNPGVAASVQTALKLLALGFGVAPELAWKPFVAATLLLLGATVACLAIAVARAGRPERVRTWGFAVFFVNAVAFAIVVGWGRSGWVPQFGIPSRYAELIVPLFVACFLCWVQFGRGGWRLWVPRMLALAMLVLVPWNTRAGNSHFAEWYRNGMHAFHADLSAGMPVDELARVHQPFLYHAMKPEDLAERMRWLKEAGVAPFDRMLLERDPAAAMRQFQP